MRTEVVSMKFERILRKEKYQNEIAVNDPRNTRKYNNLAVSVHLLVFAAPHHLGRGAVKLLGVYVNDDAALNLSL
jgi:hypothetical protein